MFNVEIDVGVWLSGKSRSLVNTGPRPMSKYFSTSHAAMDTQEKTPCEIASAPQTEISWEKTVRAPA